MLYVKSDLWFDMEHNETEDDILRQIERNETDLLLTPFPPMSLSILTTHWDLSRVIGDIPMISILSVKTQSESKFTLFKLFSTEVWLCFLLSYIMIASLKSFRSRNWNIFFTYFGIILRQNSGLKSNIDLIQFIWILISFILMSGFSGIIMSFLLRKPSYVTIESLEDLAQRGINFSVFEEETADELIKDSTEPFYEQLRKVVNVEHVENDQHEEWNEIIVAKIAKGNHALVSDAAFVKYLLATFNNQYPNLYQSSGSLYNLPYFMLIRKSLEKDFKDAFNQM